MKNYQLKLILAFFIFGLIIITVMGLVCASVFQLNQPKMIAIIVIALVILAIVCIAMAFFTVKKVIEPMSRMLKGAVSYRYFDYNTSENGNDEIENLVADLRKSLMEANSQKRQTDTILKHMTDGVIAFDMKGNVTYINPAAKQMLELRDTDDNFAKVFSKYEDVNMEKIIYLENWTSSEMKIENNQGSMNLFFVPFKDEINRPTGVMVVIQDITEHVKLDDMRKEFVADVSHELKTPLTSIKGFSETLLEGDCDKETEKHFLTIINDNADRMEKLVQDLLTLSRYDSKKNKNSIAEFDLGELAKKCTEKFEIEVRKRNQSLECFVTADVPPVQADKDGIERVIINIISNSVKYTPNGGKINVYVGYVHNDAYVKIKDTGIGIPKDDLDKVFERFYRVDKARSRKLGGTGLGLSIAKEIIEQNNGNINVSSKVGQGTEVVIRIPVKKS
ncbi:signal transduction histidine kinase [Clostridium sp. CAG:793]|nr:signal transduction histidine kinase [Clostridium sp. CAG:793]